MSADEREADALLAESLAAIQKMARDRTDFRTTGDDRDRLLRARILHDVVIKLTSPDPTPPKGGSSGQGAACPNCGRKLKIELA
ncbi:MAG: hypothetical protein JNK46_08025 [Methylobacteriaceae bacterium]|nr:hypothetical protein [Methylobacteriaceae bacterium]